MTRLTFDYFRVLTRRFSLLLLASVAIAVTPAIGAESLDAESTSGSAGADTGLQEIVVTAERRAERLRDVPISETALDMQAVDKAGVTDIESLTLAVPAFTYTSVGPWSAPTLRGLYSQVTGPGQGTGTAVYVDGVYQMSQQGTLLQLPDIQQIEVLEGPQGTLFGRNSESGAILITTQSPSTKAFSGMAEATAGDYGEIKERAFINIPVNDVLAASVSAYYEKNNGYWYDLTFHDRTGQLDAKQFRAKVLFRPTDAIQFELISTYRDALNDEAAMMVPINGDTIGTKDALQSWQVPFDRYYPYGWNNVRSYDFSLKGTIDFGGVTLTSTTAYQKLNNFIAQDGDASSAAVEFNQQWDEEHDFSQEFLLSSKYKQVDWVAGVNFYQLYGAVSPIEFYGVDDATVAALSTAVYGKAYAAFGDATWHITNRFSFIAGMRLSRESKQAYGAYEALTAPPLSPRPPPIALPEYGNKTWSAGTPRASIVFAAAESTNLYISYSQGFKSGTFPSSSIANAVEPEKLDAYEIGSKSQWRDFSLNTALYYYQYKDIQTYATLPNAAGSFFINAAAAKLYGLEITPLWKITQDLTVHGGVNLEHTEYTKFNNAIAYLPNPDGVGNITVSPYNATGDQLERAPHVSSTAGTDYAHRFAIGRIAASANVRYQSRFFWDNANSANAEAPTETLVDAQLGWTLPETPLTFTLWGKNLTNAQYWVSGTTSSLGDIEALGPPRTWGVSARYDF